MAEGRLKAHAWSGTRADDLFVVHHYTQPDVSLLRSVDVVAHDGASVSVAYEDIRSLPAREVRAVLECAGNGRGLRTPRTPGTQFGLGLFGQSTWKGTSLKNVIDLAGVSVDGVSEIVVLGMDEGLTLPENSRDQFGKGIPLAKALDPDTLVAWEMDGEPVPVEHGGPLRLVVPGWYGIWWVKWPIEVRLQDEEFSGLWQNERYTYQDEAGVVQAVVKEQLPRAVLISPSDGAEVEDRVPLEIVAWAGEQEVVTVEVTFDDGSTWLAADLAQGSGRWGWSIWTAVVPDGLPRGLRRVAVRARDTALRTQDWQPSFNRLGYGNNGIHVVQLDLTASPPAD